VPLLGGGTVMGFAELCAFLAVGFAVVFFPRNLHDMSQRARLILLVFCGGFVFQNLVVDQAPASFIYFRF
jgi:hypothetical protein